MLLYDLRHSFRLLARTPAYTAIAVLSLAITIGATAVVFTAVKTVIIQPLPYPKAGELIQIRMESTKYGKSRGDWVTWSDMQDVTRSNHTLESLGTYSYALFNLTGDRNSPPEALYGLGVSASLFHTLGVAPMLGRNILPEEDQPGRNRVIILNHGLWTRRFNADPDVIGRSIEINGHACTIIGVMPSGFDFPMRQATTVRTPSQHMDFWAPLGKDPAKQDRNSGSGAVARLRPGVSLAQADQDVKAISETLSRQYPLTNEGRILHADWLSDRTLGFARTGLLLLMGWALLFMLIGCANVANLLLARALARHREIAIRLALGAGRGRIVRQLITESCVLAIIGGMGGYALTTLAWTLLPAVAPMTIPRLAAARADWTVFAFTMAVSVLNGILFGMAPALRTAQRDPSLALRESGARGAVDGTRNRLRSALVAAEVAIAVILVVVGGLLTTSFVRLLRTDPGFQADRVLASIIIASGDQYTTPDQRGMLFRRILDSVRTLPGVESAGTVDALPFSGENHGATIGTGEPHAEQIGEVDRVSAGYLPAMGVQLIKGRLFRVDDMDASRNTAIVNDVAASRMWPGQNAVGKRFCIYCSDQFKQWKQVAGVVRTIRHSGLDEPLAPEVYYASDALNAAQFLIVRTNRPTPELAKAIRLAVAAIDPKQPVFLSASMSRLIADSVADRRFIMTLLAITGCLALMLCAAGVYGVVSHTTSLRTQEIGVRMALGATQRHVYSLVFRQSMLPAGIGIAIGLASALALIRTLRNVLVGLASTDPTLIVIALALVFATVAVACLIPARLAARVDPMAALRL